MKNMNKTARWLILFAAIVNLYFGFRFVTQYGQGLNVVQNDGYGATGGIMILVSGIVVGLLTEWKRNGKH